MLHLQNHAYEDPCFKNYITEQDCSDTYMPSKFYHPITLLIGLWQGNAVPIPCTYHGYKQLVLLWPILSSQIRDFLNTVGEHSSRRIIPNPLVLGKDRSMCLLQHQIWTEMSHNVLMCMFINIYVVDVHDIHGINVKYQCIGICMYQCKYAWKGECISDLINWHFITDYYLLEEMLTHTDSAKRFRAQFERVKHDLTPRWATLRNQARRRRIDLVYLPEGMTKRIENSSRYCKKYKFV